MRGLTNLTEGQIIHACMDCSRVRISDEWWEPLEIPAHLEDRVSHGVCPSCAPAWRAKIEELTKEEG